MSHYNRRVSSRSILSATKKNNLYDSISFSFFVRSVLSRGSKINRECHTGGMMNNCDRAHPLFWSLSLVFHHHLATILVLSIKARRQVAVWTHTFIQIIFAKQNEWSQSNHILWTWRYSNRCKCPTTRFHPIWQFLSFFSLLPSYQNTIVLIWVNTLISYFNLLNRVTINNHLVLIAVK